jgi:hypothetical protein
MFKLLAIKSSGLKNKSLLPIGDSRGITLAAIVKIHIDNSLAV